MNILFKQKNTLFQECFFFLKNDSLFLKEFEINSKPIPAKCLVVSLRKKFTRITWRQTGRCLFSNQRLQGDHLF